MQSPPRKNKPGQGRKPGPVKIKLTVHILPETRIALGDKPGAALDKLLTPREV